MTFLPQVAQDFYAVMTDPERGGCEDAVSGKGILLDPTVAEAREAIELAFDEAAKDEHTLFVAFVGHGEFAGDDHYLLPKDAKRSLRSHTAIHIGQLVKAGAGGMVGAARVAQSAPDGYQVLLGSRADAINMTLFKKPLYDFAADLMPVILIAVQPTVLLAREFPRQQSAGPPSPTENRTMT